MFKQKLAAASAAVTTAALVPFVAMAQTAPTSPQDLADSIDISSAAPAMFTVFGLLIGLGVSLWIGSLIVKRFAPK